MGIQVTAFNIPIALNARRVYIIDTSCVCVCADSLMQVFNGQLQPPLRH